MCVLKKSQYQNINNLFRLKSLNRNSIYFHQFVSSIQQPYSENKDKSNRSFIRSWIILGRWIMNYLGKHGYIRVLEVSVRNSHTSGMQGGSLDLGYIGWYRTADFCESQEACMLPFSSFLSPPLYNIFTIYQ